MILLNPGPANTTETVKQAMTRGDICPREKEFGDLLAKVRDGVTRVVHQADAFTAVLFGGSGTAAVEAAVTSAVSRECGCLLVIDNGSYGRRMVQMAEAAGIEHVVDAYSVGASPELSRVVNAIETATSRGRPITHLAVVHHETSTGRLNPVSELGALCKEHGVEMIVDAMSSYAGLPIDVAAMNASFLVSSANKCIQGMAGLSFVICERAALERASKNRAPSLYLDLGLQHRFFEQNHQMRFTPPVQVVYALEQALEEYEAEKQRGGRFARYRQNFEVLDSGVRELGFRRLLPEDVLSGILTAYVEPTHSRYQFDELHDRLYRKGFTIYPGKGADVATFRLANMGAVTPDDMRAFLKALAATIDEMNIRPLYA
jgi:2-aminoethylphosphonate aminotransferase